MNLSKTEKLLAAKKKLKEFQLQKKLQAQEISNKQNEDVVDESMSQCQTNYQSVPEMAKVCNQYNQNEAKHTEDLFHPEKYLDNVTIVHEEDTLNRAFSSTNNLIDTTEIKTATNDNELSQTVDKNPTNYIEEIISYENNDKDSTNSRLQTDLQFTAENDDRFNLNITPSNGPSMMQKEHLLEMASEVANVLTDDVDPNDTTSLDLDLKYHNQFLSTCLKEHKQVIQNLHIQISRYHSRVAELEDIQATADSEFEAKLIREVNPLKEQLQMHTQITGILVAEKAELTAALTQSQKTAKQNAEELEEMNGKLKHSQHRIGELEKELIQSRSSSNDTQKNAQQIQQIYDELETKYYELRKEKEDMELEMSELKQKLNLKNTEFNNLQQEFQEKSTLLSLNELKIQQLTDTSHTLESQHQTVTVLEKQLNQMRETLKLVNNEKEEASRQYQNYVRQLDTQQAKLLNELENANKEIDDFESREKSYVQRLSELEQHLQNEREKNEALLPVQSRNDVNNLMKHIEELTSQQERLYTALSQKDADIEMLTEEVQVLRETKDEETDATVLVQALESEKLGASRAVMQNQQLKQQLTEMENAFVTLSNTKLDLTEQLQAERSIGRKLNAKLNIVESEVDNLKDKLKEKETSLMELEKEKLQNAQITDQMQHYQAQSQHAHTLQQELQDALINIENLKKENAGLVKRLENKTQETVSKNPVNVNGDEYMSRNLQNGDDASTEQNLSLPENKKNLDDSEPVMKLEKRFKEMMEKVAELTDEKQRLEHLVLQLQGETETIGEYITLYQKQRAVLGNRWKEREQTFRQLEEQCNEQQGQLHKLKVLVTELLKKHPTESCVQLYKDINIFNPVLPDNEEQEKAEVPFSDDKTTSQILDLLTEIKDCKDKCITEPNFHPCPWCSGKLITV